MYFLVDVRIISIVKIVNLYISFIYVYILINYNDPCKTWVKISKVMPQPQVHSPGKGREALQQKVLNPSFKMWYGLTVHIIRF